MADLADNGGWSAALDLQKHFNDILFRIRGLAFAFGGAAAAVFLSKSFDTQRLFESWRWMGFAAPWLGLYVVDRLYYHELLRAAVHFAERLEAAGKAPPLCSTLTAENRKTGLGRWKVSFFYWAPLAGFSFALIGGWRPWVFSAVPFVAVEGLAWLAHRKA